MPPISLPMLMFVAVDVSLSMMIAVLQFQHNLITGHRLSGTGRSLFGPVSEKRRDGDALAGGDD